MRRPMWFRALIAIWGVWFAAAMSEGAGLHSCALHGHHAGHSAHMAHTGQMVHAAPSSAPAGRGPQTPAACTCLGVCCGAASVAAPAAAMALAADVVVDAPAQPNVDAATPAVDRLHTQPFANGPPALQLQL